MTRATIFALTLALLCAPGTAGADNAVSIRISNSWVADTSFDVVSDDDHFVQAEFGYARRLLSLLRGELWVEAGYMVGAVETSLFDGAASTRALLQNVTLGARYAYPVFAWLVPHVRLGLGLGIGSLDLDPASDQGEVTDWAAGLAGHVLAGVEVLWPRSALLDGSSDLTAGVVVEAGYGFGTDLHFSVAPDADDDLEIIPIRGAELGGLAVSGWQLRVGGVLRF